MKNVNLAIYGFVLTILSCTHHTDSCISDNAENKLQSSVVFTQNDSCYFNDLKLTDDYCVIADKEGDMQLKVYKKEDFSQTDQFAENLKSLHPVSFTKDVKEGKDENVLFFINSDQSLNSLSIETNDIKSRTIKRGLPVSVSIAYTNLSSGDIYASPAFPSNTHSFYYYKAKSPVSRIEAAPKIKDIFPKESLISVNNLCANEKQDVIVSAYRFCNYISFYDLTGKLKNTVQIGENVCKPATSMDMGIDVGASEKYFIDVCGTPEYVYCLYNGDKDFSTDSKVFIFKWNGEHIKTVQLDRPIRKFTVDKSDNYIIAISGNSAGGQDILRYSL